MDDIIDIQIAQAESMKQTEFTKSYVDYLRFLRKVDLTLGEIRRDRDEAQREYDSPEGKSQTNCWKAITLGKIKSYSWYLWHHRKAGNNGG